MVSDTIANVRQCLTLSDICLTLSDIAIGSAFGVTQIPAGSVDPNLIPRGRS